jgi:hypothetical protein
MFFLDFLVLPDLFLYLNPLSYVDSLLKHCFAPLLNSHQMSCFDLKALNATTTLRSVYVPVIGVLCVPSAACR